MNKNQIARIETGTDLQLNTDESAILANLERKDILSQPMPKGCGYAIMPKPSAQLLPT